MDFLEQLFALQPKPEAEATALLRILSVNNGMVFYEDIEWFYDDPIGRIENGNGEIEFMKFSDFFSSDSGIALFLMRSSAIAAASRWHKIP